jgi:hypothetical protein
MRLKYQVTGFCTTAILILMIACGKDDISLVDGLPEGKVFFEYVPVDLDGIQSFVGMGDLNVLPKTQGGFPLKNPFQLPATIPVYAVAKGVIVTASAGTRQIPDFAFPVQNRGKIYDDHSIKLMISKTIRVNYGHISKLNYDLLPELRDLPVDERGHNVEIPVNSGDIIGWVGPHPALDFSVSDFSLELNIINQTLFPEDQYFAADVYDYFRSTLLDQMIGIAARDQAPWGGKVDWDIEGKIIGSWFLDGTTSYTQFSRQLAIAYHHIQSERITISDGSPMLDVPGSQGPGAPNVYWVRGNIPPPEEIGPGSGIVEYELIMQGAGLTDEQKPTEGFMLVEMTIAGAMKLEIFTGTTNPGGFSPDPRNYVR